MNTAFKEESFEFQIRGALPEGACEAKALSEAQFLAGEDARGAMLVGADPRIIIGDL